jgi:hypothetical protein
MEDALLDVSNRGDVVIDPFLGSGSTLIAADRTGRVCRGVELDSLYVDVIVRRYEAAFGQEAVLVDTGETFKELEARRPRKQLDARDGFTHPRRATQLFRLPGIIRQMPTPWLA